MNPENLTTIGEIASAASIAVGCFLIAPFVGFIALGVIGFALCYLLSAPPRGGNA